MVRGGGAARDGNKGYAFQKLPRSQHTAVIMAAQANPRDLLLVDGLLAKRYRRFTSGNWAWKVNDADDPTSPERAPEKWRHIVAVFGGNLWDMYNPKGLHADHLVTSSPYMLKIYKIHKITRR